MIRTLTTTARFFLPIRNRERFLTAFLGPKCHKRRPDGTVCDWRVYPKDRVTHQQMHLDAAAKVDAQ